MTERSEAIGDVAAVAEQVAKKHHDRAFPSGSTSTTNVTDAAIGAAFSDFAAVLRVREAEAEMKAHTPQGGEEAGEGSG